MYSQLYNILSHLSHLCRVQSPPSQRAWQRRRSSCWRSITSSLWTCSRRWPHGSSHSLWLPWLHSTEVLDLKGWRRNSYSLRVFSSVESLKHRDNGDVESRCSIGWAALIKCSGRGEFDSSCLFTGCCLCPSVRLLLEEARRGERNLTPD